jgi:diguanylate cyclase (GGDEF)-like protein
MVDVNNFKQVNTKFGRLTGDTVLAEFAALLKASIRGSDAVVRYGGDEFLILLADTTIIGSEKVVDRINKHLAEWNIAGPSGRLPIACEYRGYRVARRREPRRGARCGRLENV